MRNLFEMFKPFKEPIKIFMLKKKFNELKKLGITFPGFQIVIVRKINPKWFPVELLTTGATPANNNPGGSK